MLYAASICADLDSIAEVLIFSLMFSQALFTSSPSLKFSKAANLFVISVCFLTSSWFGFLRLHLSPSKFCAAYVLNANLSVAFSTTRYWSVSQSAPLKLRTSSILEYHLICINMWSIGLWIFPSRDFQVYLWLSVRELRALDNSIFWRGKVYYSITIIITVLM